MNDRGPPTPETGGEKGAVGGSKAEKLKAEPVLPADALVVTGGG